MRITVNDIAKLANVSQSTVSKVLNGYPNVKESTKQEVMKTIKELNFTPDAVARSMITKRTNTLGLIVGDISNPYFAETAKIIIEKAQSKGYNVIISNTNHDDQNLEKAIETLLSKRVDGLLITSVSSHNQEHIQNLCKGKIPTLLFINYIEGENVNYVVLDNKKGAQIAVEYLINIGHKNIAFISGPFKYSAISHRYFGYKEALALHDIPIKDGNIYNGELVYENVYHFVDNLLSTDDRPTAIFASSDNIALTILDVAAYKGMDIPKDLSVIGFDNMDISSNQYISLTTVSHHKERLATLALEKLLLLIEKGDLIKKPIQLIIEPELIIRKTSSELIVQNT